jgi:hypothetical protein
MSTPETTTALVPTSTPSTIEVLCRYQEWGGGSSSDDTRRAEFNSWLAAREAKVRADTLEAAAKAVVFSGIPIPMGANSSPADQERAVQQWLREFARGLDLNQNPGDDWSDRELADALSDRDKVLAGEARAWADKIESNLADKSWQRTTGPSYRILRDFAKHILTGGR